MIELAQAHQSRLPAADVRQGSRKASEKHRASTAAEKRRASEAEKQEGARAALEPAMNGSAVLDDELVKKTVAVTIWTLKTSGLLGTGGVAVAGGVPGGTPIVDLSRGAKAFDSDDDVRDDMFSRPQKSLPGKQIRTSSAAVDASREREVSPLQPTRGQAGTRGGPFSPSDTYSNTPSPRARPTPSTRGWVAAGGAGPKGRTEEEPGSQPQGRRRVRVMRRVRRDGSLSPTRRVKGSDGVLEA